MKSVPQGIAIPQKTLKAAKAPPGWAPSDRKLGFFTAKRTRPEAPPKFWDPTGRTLHTSPSAFRINPDAIVAAPLRRTVKKAGRKHRSIRRKARRTRRS